MKKIFALLLFSVVLSCSNNGNKETNERLKKSVERIEEGIGYADAFPLLIETVFKNAEIENELVRDSLQKNQFRLIQIAKQSYESYFDSVSTDISYFKENGINKGTLNELIDIFSDAKAYMELVQDPNVTQEQFVSGKNSLKKSIENFKLKYIETN